MAARLVQCTSCGATLETSEAVALEPADAAGPDATELLEQAPELVRFYCLECWDAGAS